ncbi:MAG: hypothetical protein N2316_01275 [Spirochaetes bacterium]|nr:hypothetical protein [Spirochaetota bacterium]
MHIRNFWGIIAFICAVVFPVGAFANFADTYGFSAQGVARGNAMAAIVNDWSSVYYNMAGLGRTVSEQMPADVLQSKSSKLVYKEGEKTLATSEKAINEYDVVPFKDQLAITYMLTQPKMKIDIARDTVADDELGFGTITIGLVIDINKFVRLPDFISSGRFGMGLGVMQDGSLVKVYDVDLRTHDYLRYGREAQRAVILSGVGFGFLNDLFGFGVGASVWSGGSGAVQLVDVGLGTGTQYPNQQVQMELTPAIAPVAGLYISPGQKVEALKGLDFGVFYRGELYMEVTPFATEAQLNMGGITLNMGLNIFDYYTPHIVGGGLAYSIFGALLSLEAEYQMWSKHRVSKSKEIYWNSYGIEIPQFNDILVYKVGLSYYFGYLSPSMRWLTFNAGYMYRPTFVPDDANKTIFNFMDCNTQIFSVGFDFKIPRMGPMVAPIIISITGQMQKLQEREVVKDEASVIAIYQDINASWTGSQILAVNPSYYTYGGQVMSLFVSVTIYW